jgi:hypothetical protein
MLVLVKHPASHPLLQTDLLKLPEKLLMIQGFIITLARLVKEVPKRRWLLRGDLMMYL